LEKSIFFNSVGGDRVYSADDFREFYGDLFGNGVVYASFDSLRVEAGTGMVVNLMAGSAFIHGCRYYNTAGIEMQIDPTEGQYPRIDRIVIRYSVEDREIKAAVLKGEASTAPQPPALTRGYAVYELCVADVYIAASAGAITADNITDNRMNYDLCGTARTRSYMTFGEADTEAFIQYFNDRLNETKKLEIVNRVYWGYSSSGNATPMQRWELVDNRIKGNKTYILAMVNPFYNMANKYPPVNETGTYNISIILPIFTIVSVKDGRIYMNHQNLKGEGAITAQNYNFAITLNDKAIYPISYEQITNPFYVSGYYLNSGMNTVYTNLEFTLIEMN
jgi:hypothetical protein